MDRIRHIDKHHKEPDRKVRFTAHVRADTPYGVTANRSMVEVSDIGIDGVHIEFHVGNTPIQLNMVGGNFLAFVRACIALAGPMNRSKLEQALDEQLSA